MIQHVYRLPAKQSIRSARKPSANKYCPAAATHKVARLAVLLLAGSMAWPMFVVAQESSAEAATDTVDTYIGIESPFRVICTSLNFGVWFVPMGDRGGESVLSLDIKPGTTDTEVNVTGAESSRLAVIQDSGYESPLASVCNVRGSLAANNTAITISFEGTENIDMGFVADTHIFAQGLEAAPEPTDLRVTLRTPETGRTSVLITNGEAVFRVVGDLTIPAVISRLNYGADRVEAPATIIVNDGVGG